MTSPQILELARWPAARGPLSEEAVRGLHLPNYRHRFGVQKYPSGTAFAGRQRASTCYVLSGSCEFTFGERSILLRSGDVGALPAGDFTFRVVDRSDVLLLCVWALPFDVVHHRRDAIEYLEDNGVHATARDWALGETIFAYQLPEEHRGITVWKQSLCLAPEEDTWFVQDLAQQSRERHSFSDLKSACDHVIATWLNPNWRRLPRDEAKRLLATSRKASISEQRKLEILDEYLVYEKTADIHEAIRNGELPALDDAAVARLVRGDRPERFPHELDPLLEDRLVFELTYALNAYIREELRSYGHDVIVEGQMERGGVCPCCEYLAIDAGEDGLWDICRVCFWENGGDGPNHLTLVEAKKNFDAWGAIDRGFLQQLAADRMRKFRRAWRQPVRITAGVP
jgi:hypothetical protein